MSASPPPIHIDHFTNSLGDCEAALGHFMSQWNQMEHALFAIFAKLLGANGQAARIVFSSGINAQTLREIIVALGGQRLDVSELRELEGLMESAKKASTKRNRIVHGRWNIYIKFGKGGNIATWERFYDPTDPRLYEKMMGTNRSQKTIDGHVFPVETIRKLALDYESLAKRISLFSNSATMKPFKVYSHIDIPDSRRSNF